MPTTTVEKLGPTRARLTITVSPDELKPSIATAYRQIANQVTVPGFRRGKVPPQIIDRRVGKATVLEQAVGAGIDEFFREAVSEHDLRPLGQPQADVVDWPDTSDFSGDLRYTVEVDVRPEITLPAYDTLQITVDRAEANESDIDAEIDRLRTRFGTLISVERAACTGDFLTIDLRAEIDGAEIERADGVSYELGSGELLEGIDDALDTLSAGETTTFRSTLVGGEHAGESAEVTVTVQAVRERELPPVDDDFAQTASEFDTIAELRESLRGELGQRALVRQAQAARDGLLERLLEVTDVPVVDSIIEHQVQEHLKGEERLEDDEHRSEVTAELTVAFQRQVILDTIVDRDGVQVSQEELTQYLIQLAGQYRVEPTAFVRQMGDRGQLPTLAADVARTKAISLVLGRVAVVDTDGQPVDLSMFATPSASEAPSGGTRSIEVDVAGALSSTPGDAEGDTRETATADEGPETEDDVAPAVAAKPKRDRNRRTKR